MAQCKLKRSLSSPASFLMLLTAERAIGQGTGEEKAMGRGMGEATAVVGYAGGREAGPDGKVCYYLADPKEDLLVSGKQAVFGCAVGGY
eukprot:106438-Pelagomonas_calceolata.AAC.1